jgi:hypothetical protein
VSDRFDRAVTGMLAAAALTCAVGAAMLQPEPLPAVDAARWIELAKRTHGDEHRFGSTWRIDTIDVGATRLSYTDQILRLPQGDQLTVRGWALDPALRRTAADVEYRLDRGSWHHARYHLPRPDVGVALNPTGSGDSGYSVAVPTAALAPGPHELELATVGPHGLRRMRPALRFDVTVRRAVP